MRFRIRGIGRLLNLLPRPLYPYREFPTLERALSAHAALYPNRVEMLRALAVPHQATVAEVGVALGDFSALLIEILAPREFVAIDLFDLHMRRTVWDMNSLEIFKGQSHRMFYQQRLSLSPCLVTIREGLSYVELAKFPDDYFDLLYVDADHSYEAVARDIDAARNKLRPGGFMIFNDYIMYDHLGHRPYGVVPAVNEFVSDSGWPVLGLALHPQLFCDIALQRPIDHG